MSNTGMKLDEALAVQKALLGGEPTILLPEGATKAEKVRVLKMFDPPFSVPDDVAQQVVACLEAQAAQEYATYNTENAQLRREVEHWKAQAAARYEVSEHRNKECAALREERDKLQGWKDGAMLVDADIMAVDSFIRNHKDTLTGASVWALALAWLKERDALKNEVESWKAQAEARAEEIENLRQQLKAALARSFSVEHENLHLKATPKLGRTVVHGTHNGKRVTITQLVSSLGSWLADNAKLHVLPVKTGQSRVHLTTTTTIVTYDEETEVQAQGGNPEGSSAGDIQVSGAR